MIQFNVLQEHSIQPQDKLQALLVQLARKENIAHLQVCLLLKEIAQQATTAQPEQASNTPQHFELQANTAHQVAMLQLHELLERK